VTALDDLLALATRLQDIMNEVLDAATVEADLVKEADWAWYRFSSACMLVRDEGGGTIAASLARGLLEQAAYWDWAIAIEVGHDHLARRAAVEHGRLTDLGHQIDDKVWLGWLLPPGAAIRTADDAGVPNAPDIVRRMGNGLAAPILDALRFKGVFSAARILDVLSHGNMAAALVMAPGGGAQLPDELAAAVIQVAASGCTATVVSVLKPDQSDIDRLTTAARAVADAAVAVHGLSLTPPKHGRRLPKAQRGRKLFVESSIDRMPTAAGNTDRAVVDFTDLAAQLVQAANAAEIHPDPSARVAVAVLSMAWEQLRILRHGATEHLGRALAPYAARGLLEDGARWDWLRRGIEANANGESLRAILHDSGTHVAKIQQTLQSDGVPRATIDQMLGPAIALLDVPDGDLRLPNIEQLVHETYKGTADEYGRPMYSVLSQFVHATPLSTLHVHPGVFHSLTAPTWSIAVEAASRGFLLTAHGTTRFALAAPEEVDEELIALVKGFRAVHFACAPYHLLG
jgi:hypothetical protein